MCGIAGILKTRNWVDHVRGGASGGSGPVTAELSAILGELRHRGPDDGGLQSLSGDAFTLQLGHTRLSIIDLSSAGRQPMSAANGSLFLAYNGEIYNFRELRDRIGDSAGPWQSHSDTEVVLKAFEVWGVDAFAKLRGMFALAIWDACTQTLTLARDRFGIKPLYFYQDSTSLVFASEVRAILATGLVPRRLSARGLRSFLASGAVKCPDTIVEGIKSVRPGQYLTVRATDGSIDVEESMFVDEWSLASAAPRPKTRAEAVDAVRARLEESVEAHLVSDVPVAIFLSGGIDSSVIAALASKVSRPKTFTVVFDEAEFSERRYASQMADRYNLDHTEIPLSEDEYFELLPRALASMDQPTIDGVNTYVVSSAVRKSGIKVALSGLGSDELFAGYPSFKRALVGQKLDVIPSAARRALASAGSAVFNSSVQQRKGWQYVAGGGNPIEVYTTTRQLFSYEEIESMLASPASVEREASNNHAASPEYFDDAVNAISFCELTGYMADMLLRDADQMGMACSLEIRVPFVDQELVSYVLGLPGEWKVNGGRPKPLLLDAIGDLLPREIWDRPKMGFQLPLERWMRSRLSGELERSSNGTEGESGNLARLGLTERAKKAWNVFKQSPGRERWARPWAVHVLIEWCRLNGVEA